MGGEARLLMGLCWWFWSWSYRYDAIPDALILNNTVQVQYSTSAPAAEPFTFDTPPTEYSTYPIFDDTIVKPLLVNASAPPDQEFTIVATFDVSGLGGVGGRLVMETDSSSFGFVFRLSMMVRHDLLVSISYRLHSKFAQLIESSPMFRSLQSVNDV